MLYFVRIDQADGRLVELEMVPVQTRKFRLVRASVEDGVWLRRTLDREGRRFGTGVEQKGDGTLALKWDVHQN